MFRKTLVVLWARLAEGMAALAGVILLFLMVSVSADVAGRYVFKRPIGWVVEFAEYGLLMIAFLAMAWLVRENAHVRIDVVIQGLGEKSRSAVDGVTSLVAAVTCASAGFWAAAASADNYARDVTTVGIYPIPKFIPLSVIAFGLALSAVEFLRRAARAFQDWRSGTESPAPSGEE